MWPATARATAQAGDVLLYKGQTHRIHTNPLEMYFDEVHPRPKDIFQASCSACWRGYVATWEIKDDGFLYLVKLVEGTCGSDAPGIPLEKVFPGQTGPIKATWFTGMLRAPHGEMLHYVHMGYQSRYEKDLHIFIENGKVEREETIDNRPKDLEGKDKKIEDLKGKKDGNGKDDKKDGNGKDDKKNGNGKDDKKDGDGKNKKKDGDGKDKKKDGNGNDKKKDDGDGENKKKDCDGKDKKKDGNGNDKKKDDGEGEKSSPRKPRIPVA